MKRVERGINGRPRRRVRVGVTKAWKKVRLLVDQQIVRVY